MQAWIERDASGRYQSRFVRTQATSRYTTNTICNCYTAIAVGAYDPTRSDRPPTKFSSRGPTSDGRQKPELAAPGYRIRAARSMPKNGWRGQSKLVAKSGTSMAAPFVSGTVALMFAAAGRRLTIHEIRRALIGSVDPHPGPRGRTSTQLGYGYLNVEKAVAAARRLGATRAEPSSPPPRRPELYEELPLENFEFVPLAIEDSGAETQSGESFEPEMAEDIETESIEAEITETVAPARPCGCGKARAAESAMESGWEIREQFDASEEPETAPVEWEDVQEALEAVGVAED